MSDEESALAILNQFPSFYQSSNKRIEQQKKRINIYYDLFKTIDCSEDYNVIAVVFKNLFSELLYRKKDYKLNRILKQYEKEAIDLLDDIAKEDCGLKAYLNN